MFHLHFDNIFLKLVTFSLNQQSFKLFYAYGYCLFSLYDKKYFSDYPKKSIGGYDGFVNGPLLYSVKEIG
jgi:hypothetical protein